MWNVFPNYYQSFSNSSHLLKQCTIPQKIKHELSNVALQMECRAACIQKSIGISLNFGFQNCFVDLTIFFYCTNEYKQFFYRTHFRVNYFSSTHFVSQASEVRLSYTGWPKPRRDHFSPQRYQIRVLFCWFEYNFLQISSHIDN